MKMPTPVLKTPGVSIDSSLVAVIRSLLETTPKKVRGPWHHYACPSCGDHSAHLGINIDTGGVRCFRCDLRLNISTPEERNNRDPIRSDTHQINKNRGASPYDKYSSDESDGGLLDKSVDEYMTSRGVPDPRLGWSYGRDMATGCPVFNCRNAKGDIVYSQFRLCTENGSRYCTVERGLEPRLDCTQVLNGTSSSILVINEGPISSLATRKLGVWSVYNSGKALKHTICRDIEYATVQFDLKTVYVWFDDEPIAEDNAEVMATVLKTQYGVDTKIIRWHMGHKHSGKDQADVDTKTLVEQFSKGLSDARNPKS